MKIFIIFAFTILGYSQIPTKSWEIKLDDTPTPYYGHSSIVSVDGSTAVYTHSSDTKLFWVDSDGDILFEESVQGGVIFLVSNTLLIYGINIVDNNSDPAVYSYQKISLTKNVDETITKTIIEAGDGEIKNLQDDKNLYTGGYYQIIETNDIVLAKYEYSPSSIELSPAVTGIDVNDNLVISWESVIGRSYQVQSSQALDGVWINEGNVITGNSSVLSYSTPRSNSTNFLRVIEP